MLIFLIVSGAAWIAISGAASIAIGFAIGRWVIVIILGAAWPLFFLGLKQGWWGYGVGDGWQAALVAGTVAATVAGVAGVFARRTVAHSRRPSPG